MPSISTEFLEELLRVVKFSVLSIFFELLYFLQNLSTAYKKIMCTLGLCWRLQIPVNYLIKNFLDKINRDYVTIMKHRCKDDISVGTCHETKLKGRWSMRGLKKVSWFSKRNKSDIGSLPDISVTCQQLEYPLLNDKKINKLVTFAPCSFGNHVKEKRQNVCSYGDVDDKRQNACSYEDHIEDKRQNAFESSSFGKVENKRRNTFDSSSLSNVEDKRRNTTTGKQRPWISCDDQYVGCMKESKFFDSYKHCRSLNSLSDSLSNLLSISSSNLLSTEIDSFVPGVANYLKTAELCQIAQEVHSQQTDEWFRLNKQYHSWPKQKHSYLSKINHVSSYHNFGLTTGSSDDGTNRCHGKQQRELFLGSSHVENRSLLLKRLQVTDISHEVNDFNDIYSHRKKNANPQQQDEIDSMINYEKQRKLQFETLSPILRRDIKENRTRNTFDLVEGIYEKNPKIYNVNEVKNTSKSVNTKDIFTNNVVTPFDQVYSSIFEKHGTSDTDIQIANRTSETDTDIQIANVSEDDFSESINELLKTNEIHECVNLEHTTKNTDASGDMDGDIFDDLPLSSSHIVVNNTINKADNEITLKSEVECEECTQFSINSTFSNSCDCINESSRTTNTEEVDESSKTLDSSAADQDVKCPMKDHHETISSTSSFDDSDDGGTDSGVGQQSDFNPLFNHNIGINPPLFKKRADVCMKFCCHYLP